MSVANIEPISVYSTNSYWGVGYANNEADAVDVAAYYPGDFPSNYGNGYVYGYYDQGEFQLNMGTIASANSVTQVKIWLFAYNYTYAPANEYVTIDLYINGAWVGEQHLPNVEEDWTSVTFTGTWSSTSNVRVKVRYDDPYGWGDGCQINRLYAEVTYTSGPASHVTVSGPALALTGVASTITYGLDGTNSGVTVTPTDGGGGGAFSPSSFTLSTSTPTQAVSYTPGSTGTKTIGSTDSGTLTNNTLSLPVYNPSGTATFLSTDTSTQGTWQGVFGFDGYSIANDAQSLPSYISAFTFSGANPGTWTTGTDTRYVQRILPNTDRIASYWYNNTQFTLTVTTTALKRLRLYFMDYDPAGRAADLKIYETTNNVLLYSGSMSNFANGIWFNFSISGTVRFEFTATYSNVVLQAVMFDAAPGPATYVQFTGNPASTPVGTASGTITVMVGPNGSTGSPSCVVTPVSSRAGTFTPTSRTLTDAARTGTFTFTPSEHGSHTLSLTNNQSLTNANTANLLATGTAPAGTAAARTNPTYTGGVYFHSTNAILVSHRQALLPRDHTGSLRVYTSQAAKDAYLTGNLGAKDYTGPMSITITTPVTPNTSNAHLFFQMN